MDTINLLIVLVCVLASASLIEATAADDGLTISLSTGKIRGKLEDSKAKHNTSLRVFRGIPYAEPPLGKLRFKAPVPISAWNDTKDLSNFDIVDCVRATNKLDSTISEDCLTINVYAPVLEKINFSRPLPVMVWIYGGGFVEGSTNPGYQGGDFLIEQGLIFVSFNYRVSALGFLNLGTADAPGNAGLKDQNLALQWVQKEIIKFGGDPTRVTIFGESAGSASVIYQYLAPKSKGLFQYAIAHSGNSLADWAFLETGFKERGRQLSDKLNCTKDNVIDIACLQSADVSLFAQYQAIEMPEENVVSGSTFAFVPSLEEKSDEAFLTETPVSLLKSKENSNVPLIMGINHDEGLMELKGYNNTFYGSLPSKLSDFIPKAIRDKKSSDQLQNDTASINLEYLNNTVPGRGNFEGFIKLYTDFMFALSTAQFAQQRASQGNIFLYHFDFDGSFRQTNTIALTMGVTGVNHGEEKRYFLKQDDLNQQATADNVTEKIVMNRMVKILSNFAKTGNPTPNDDADSKAVLGNFQWTPINENHTKYLIITNNIEMSQENFHEKAVNFWAGILTSASSRITFSFLVVISSFFAMLFT